MFLGAYALNLCVKYGRGPIEYRISLSRPNITDLQSYLRSASMSHNPLAGMLLGEIFIRYLLPPHHVLFESILWTRKAIPVRISDFMPVLLIKSDTLRKGLPFIPLDNGPLFVISASLIRETNWPSCSPKAVLWIVYVGTHFVSPSRGNVNGIRMESSSSCLPDFPTWTGRNNWQLILHVKQTRRQQCLPSTPTIGPHCRNSIPS